MGLFAAIRSRLAPKQTLLGLTDATCPYCQSRLSKKPGRKKKCPHCSNYIFVRTRPQDSEKVLLREDQLVAMEEHWSIANGTHNQFLQQQSRRRTVTDQLRVRFGCEPSAHDVDWAILNEDSLTHARNNDWGFYRNSRFAMAEILRKEKKHAQCIDKLLEVCFLDLNGPNNCGGLPRDLLTEHPPFDPSMAELAPGVVGLILSMMDATNISIDHVEKQFGTVGHQLSASLHLPVSAEKAWPKLKQALASP